MEMKDVSKQGDNKGIKNRNNAWMDQNYNLQR